ncbi:fumarylacetoacetate hydrolase family protein [Streptomyces sp. ISL-98]|nr:fumarylacetoacetate hydrolase family protein [Streptomyces sp. ISL-98]
MPPVKSAESVADGRLLARLARELSDAARTRVPVPLLSERFPDLTLSDAYRIQRINMERRVSAGGRVIGHKIGLTSAAMQEQMGIHEPDSGFVFDSMASPSGFPLRAADFMNPRIETEIAFRIGHDLAATADLEEVRSAVAGVFLAFEILDTCFPGWNMTLVDSIADNAACARVILGNQLPFAPGWDLATEKITANINGEISATGEGRDILGNPLNALTWLTRRLADQGTVLRAGDIVLAGSVHASVPLAPKTDFYATSTRLPAVHLRVL